MKTISTTIILALAVMMIFAGCTEADLTDEQMQAKLIKANSEVETYSAKINMDMDMNIVTDEESGSVKMMMTGTLDVDQVKKELGMQAKMTMDMGDLATEEVPDMLSDGISMDMYLVDNVIYTQVMGMWIKMPAETEMWDQQNHIEHFIEYLETGSIERLDDQTMDGKEFYVVKLKPDFKKVIEYALKQQSQGGVDYNLDEMNIQDMIQDYTSTIWVNKKTFVIEKSEEELTMVMTPENMGAMGAEMEGSMTMDMKMSSELYNINGDVSIELPSAAKNAMDLSSLGGMMSDPEMSG